MGAGMMAAQANMSGKPKGRGSFMRTVVTTRIYSLPRILCPSVICPHHPFMLLIAHMRCINYFLNWAGREQPRTHRGLVSPHFPKKSRQSVLYWEARLRKRGLKLLVH